MTDKLTELRALGLKRQQTTVSGYLNLSEFENGYYECEFVSPWTKSACNTDADLMLVAQDWASAKYLRKRKRPAVAELGHDPALKTNINLKSLLQRHFNLQFKDTYATNVFPFIKEGSMDAKIDDPATLAMCAREFVLSQIEIVKPKMVICIGEVSFNEIRSTLGLPRLSSADARCAPVGHTTFKRVEIYGVAHTGHWGTMSREGRMDNDWSGLAKRMDDLKRAAHSKSDFRDHGIP
jgi:restriction system protein